MKASKGKAIAVIRNQHTKEEMREIEKLFLDPNAKRYTLQETIEMSKNENLHQNR
ncbi:hypothetical protein [Dyadobacter psychrophilus]|uniref:Uncharacterized protein n=1 Tax=Dyadobacter psychrophilus TaxID=651661 RepID=A0A1T5HAK4_9BACT|nr:hypothetical protein [Dyadobacter psychrophilus]SKC17743.1 hypothetical protein SAMN05660293_05179 [Dyadobacter psychrophilus]